jgi:hypothetical protein
MRVHRTKATINQDGSLNVMLTGLPFAHGERVCVVVMEDEIRSPLVLSYRSAAPPPVNNTPEGEWVLFVAGAILAVVSCFVLLIIR